MIFSAESIRNIPTGRKTMTRRIIKPQPKDGIRVSQFYPSGLEDLHGYEVKCPYVPGREVWVKETWRIMAMPEDPIVFQYTDLSTGEESEDSFEHPGYEAWVDRMYEQLGEDCVKADIKEDDDGYTWDYENCPTRWRSPLYMPRWASRYTLTIISCKAERVEDISEEDAYKEGYDSREAFLEAFYRLNRKHVEPGSNPFVFAVEFEVKHGNV